MYIISNYIFIQHLKIRSVSFLHLVNKLNRNILVNVSDGKKFEVIQTASCDLLVCHRINLVGVQQALLFL